MHIELTAAQRKLRDELRAYFAGLLTPAERETMLTARHGEVYRDLVRRMGRDGWLGVGWPVEYGGHGFGEIEQQIFVNEAARADVPLPYVTLQTVGPTLQAFGTDEQKSWFLPRILAGDIHFAIGYTEPNAGTDLASLRTKAVRDGDHRDLHLRAHSFPTRRSSDLAHGTGWRRCAHRTDRRATESPRRDRKSTRLNSSHRP